MDTADTGAGVPWPAAAVAPFYPEMVVYREDIMQRVSEVASKTGSVLFNTLFSFTYSAVNELFLFFIFLYTVFFFLRDGRSLLETILYYLPLSDADQQRLLDKFLSVTRATIKGTMIVGVVQGTLAGLALHIAGIESALFWGTMMTVLSVVPVLGPLWSGFLQPSPWLSWAITRRRSEFCCSAALWLARLTIFSAPFLLGATHSCTNCLYFLERLEVLASLGFSVSLSAPSLQPFL